MTDREFKVGDEIAYKIQGSGMTHYEGEGDTVTRIEDGRIFTECYDTMGFVNKLSAGLGCDQ